MKTLFIQISLLAFTLTAHAQTGIQLVKVTGNNAAANMVVHNNKLILQATEPSRGVELFTSDGTTAGTVLLKDIVSGSAGSNPRFFKNALGKVLFRAGSSGFNDSLYITDGTASGTKSLCLLSMMSMPTFGIELNGKYYFINGVSATGDELWVTDGTASGTQLVKDIASGTSGSNIQYFEKLNNMILFNADDHTGGSGDELWVSDGTTAGTHLLKDIFSGSQSSGIRGLTAYNGNVYFGADNGINGNELWKSDGTASGTLMLKDILSGSSSGSMPFGFTLFNSKMYFVAEGAGIARELYETDGTAAGTLLTKDIDAGTLSSLPQGLYAVGNNLFFSARLTNSCGYELMAYSSATGSVTVMADAFPGTSTGFLSVVNALGEYNIASVGSNAVITAYEANNLQNIWMSDGTPAGTSRITLAGPSYSSASQSYLTVFNNEVYFYGTYGNGTKSLYKLGNSNPTMVTEHDNQIVHVSLYPNPVKGNLNVELETVTQDKPEASIMITDIVGKVVYQNTILQSKETYDISKLHPGIYTVSIIGKQLNSMKKIVVE